MISSSFQPFFVFAQAQDEDVIALTGIIFHLDIDQGFVFLRLHVLDLGQGKVSQVDLEGPLGMGLLVGVSPVTGQDAVIDDFFHVLDEFGLVFFREFAVWIELPLGIADGVGAL